MLTVRTEISEQAKGILRDLGATGWLMEAIRAEVERQNEVTVGHIQETYLSFPRDEPATEIGLRVQTNRLRQSLWASPPVVKGDKVESVIGNNVTSHGVNYAAVHEFGADIPPHTITAKGKALRFQIGERVVFAKSVQFPGAHIPARAPIQRGISDRLDAMGAAVSGAIVKAWEARA